MIGKMILQGLVAAALIAGAAGLYAADAEGVAQWAAAAPGDLLTSLEDKHHDH